MPSRDSVTANRAKYYERLARTLLTDVDTDGETLLVLPYNLVVATLTTWSCLKNANTFEQARHDRGASALLDVHMLMYRERRVSLGEEDSDEADGDPFDATLFFGEENWAIWTPVARILTHAFLSAGAPELAARYCRPDTGSGWDYEPCPFVHVAGRDALEVDLAERGYEVRQWPGLAAMYLEPPVNIALALRL